MFFLRKNFFLTFLCVMIDYLNFMRFLLLRFLFDFLFSYGFILLLGSQAPMGFLHFSFYYWLIVFFSGYISVFLRLFWRFLWYMLSVCFPFGTITEVSAHQSLLDTVFVMICVLLVLLFFFFIFIMNFYTHLYKCWRQGSKDEFWAFALVWAYFAFI
jgi:hypothetical protein